VLEVADVPLGAAVDPAGDEAADVDAAADDDELFESEPHALATSAAAAPTVNTFDQARFDDI